jgi:hypothetical protein
MLTDLFLVTTDPSLDLVHLFQIEIIAWVAISVVFHTVVYTGFVNLVSVIFMGKLLSGTVNERFVIAAVVIMTLGYLARFYHIKDIYRAYRGDVAKTREHANKLYISWIFIG